MTQHALIFRGAKLRIKSYNTQIFLIVFQKIVCSLLHYKYNLYLCIKMNKCRNAVLKQYD